jgi:hypothetical protein
MLCYYITMLTDQIMLESIAMTASSFPLGPRFLSRSGQFSFLAWALMLSAISLAIPLKAAERHHHAHEHGVSKLKVAIDGPLLEIQLDSPGMDIVGFEHAPSNDADRQVLAKAGALLAGGGSLFILPADARCGLLDADIDHPFLSADTGKHEHGDKHGHQHGGPHGHAGAAADGHSTFRAHYRFRCENIEKLTRIDVKLFEKFPAAREIEVEAITPKGQIARALTPASPQLKL